MSALTRRVWIAGLGIVAVAGAGAVGYRVWRDQEPAAPPTQDEAGQLVWRNWSGNQHAYPSARLAPASEDEVAALLRTAQGPIRPVGAGHSFTALVPTAGTLVTLDGVTGLVSHDASTHEATLWAGTKLGDLGPALAAIGQEMANLPDINKQSFGGAIATATHGTGRELRALHGEIQSLRIATPRGDILECSAAQHAGLFEAAKVGLGAYGIVTQARIRNQPLKRVFKRVSLMDQEEAYARWFEVVSAHRNAEMYFIPFTGLAALITLDETERRCARADPIRTQRF